MEFVCKSFTGTGNHCQGHCCIINALQSLKSICASYTHERIYNLDETCLFYRLEPDQSLATYKLAGRKKDKERLTIANSDGSHKLNPLVLVNSQNRERCPILALVICQ